MSFIILVLDLSNKTSIFVERRQFIYKFSTILNLLEKKNFVRTFQWKYDEIYQLFETKKRITKIEILLLKSRTRIINDMISTFEFNDNSCGRERDVGSVLVVNSVKLLLVR